MEAACGGLPTRTDRPQKSYRGTFVQLENLFSSDTLHSRLLPDLLAPGTTPALQLPALDLTWTPKGHAGGLTQRPESQTVHGACLHCQQS